MKLNVKTTVSFTANDIKQIIEEYCKEEYERSVKSITFKLDNVYDDRQMGTASRYVFGSVDVELGEVIQKFPEEEPYEMSSETLPDR